MSRVSEGRFLRVAEKGIRPCPEALPGRRRSAGLAAPPSGARTGTGPAPTALAAAATAAPATTAAAPDVGVQVDI